MVGSRLNCMNQGFCLALLRSWPRGCHPVAYHKVLESFGWGECFQGCVIFNGSAPPFEVPAQSTKILLGKTCFELSDVVIDRRCDHL